MAEVKTFKCDVCGTHKNSETSWWLVFQANGAVITEPWNETARQGAYIYNDACGIECALKLTAQQMNLLREAQA